MIWSVKVAPHATRFWRCFPFRSRAPLSSVPSRQRRAAAAAVLASRELGGAPVPPRGTQRRTPPEQPNGNGECFDGSDKISTNALPPTMTEFSGTTMADGRLVNSIGFEKKNPSFTFVQFKYTNFYSIDTPNVFSQCGELRVHKECELNFSRFNLQLDGSPSMVFIETCIHRGLDVSSVLSKAPMKTLHVVHCVLLCGGFFAALTTYFKIGRSGGSGRNRKEGARIAAKKEMARDPLDSYALESSWTHHHHHHPSGALGRPGWRWGRPPRRPTDRTPRRTPSGCAD